jgi:hypothetical protein
VPDVFDRIREAARVVSERARFVTIDGDGLVRLADGIAARVEEPAQLDPAHHFAGSPEDTLAYVVTLDAVNFGSGWFPLLVKRPGCSGYFTIATALKEHFETEGPWSAEALRTLTPDTCAQILGQQNAPREIVDLMTFFARAWNDLGNWLDARFASRFEGILRESARSAATLVDLLSEMPLYRDVARYQTFDVPIYKRAQLTAADLSLALPGGAGHFHDLDRLTIFADNLVPHVLRFEGVLRYEPDLASRIDSGILIEPGSDEETEIRAVAVHAVEQLVTLVRDRGRSVNAQRLDHLLWNRGQSPEMKAHPRHRTRTVYY